MRIVSPVVMTTLTVVIAACNSFDLGGDKSLTTPTGRPATGSTIATMGSEVVGALTSSSYPAPNSSCSQMTLF